MKVINNWESPKWELWRDYRGQRTRCGRYQRRTEALAAKDQLKNLWGGWSLEIKYVESDVLPRDL